MGVRATHASSFQHTLKAHTGFAEHLPHMSAVAQDTEPRLSSRYVRGVQRVIDVAQELSLTRGLDAIMVIVRRAARALTGLDEAIRERLFERFYTTQRAGLGIGLATCQRIVDAHGRNIRAECSSSVAAAFHFTPALQS